MEHQPDFSYAIIKGSSFLFLIISSPISVLLIEVKIHQIPSMSKTHMIRYSEAEAGASAHHPIAPDPVCPEEPAANSGGTSTLVDN